MDSLSDGISMLCDECLGSDKSRDTSPHYYYILQTAFILLDLSCRGEVSPCPQLNALDQIFEQQLKVAIRPQEQANRWR